MNHNKQQHQYLQLQLPVEIVFAVLTVLLCMMPPRRHVCSRSSGLWRRMCTCNTPILFWMSAYSLLTVLSLCCALCIPSLLMCIQHQSTICLLLGFERPTYSRPPFRKRWGRPPWEDASSYLNDYHFGGITVFPNVGIRKVLFQYWKG